MTDIAETHAATFEKLVAARIEADRLRVENAKLLEHVDRLGATANSFADEITSLRKMIAHIASGARGVAL